VEALPGSGAGLARVSYWQSADSEFVEHEGQARQRPGAGRCEGHWQALATGRPWPLRLRLLTVTRPVEGWAPLRLSLARHGQHWHRDWPSVLAMPGQPGLPLAWPGLAWPGLALMQASRDLLKEDSDQSQHICFARP
jgi:hypothetical protein